MSFKIDHIGYITDSIDATSREFELLGYIKGDKIDDDTQRTHICFMHKNGEVTVELVEPYADNKTMQKMLAKRGVSPYHLCYAVDDIDDTFNQLISQDWTALFAPVAAPAFDGRKICYFWKSEIGFIEILSKQ